MAILPTLMPSSFSSSLSLSSIAVIPNRRRRKFVSSSAPPQLRSGVSFSIGTHLFHILTRLLHTQNTEAQINTRLRPRCRLEVIVPRHLLKRMLQKMLLGNLTWEWKKGIRSYMHPMVFVFLYKFLAFLHLDTPWFMLEQSI